MIQNTTVELEPSGHLLTSCKVTVGAANLHGQVANDACLLRNNDAWICENKKGSITLPTFSSTSSASSYVSLSSPSSPSSSHMNDPIFSIKVGESADWSNAVKDGSENTKESVCRLDADDNHVGAAINEPTEKEGLYSLSSQLPIPLRYHLSSDPQPVKSRLNSPELVSPESSLTVSSSSGFSSIDFEDDEEQQQRRLMRSSEHKAHMSVYEVNKLNNEETFTLYGGDNSLQMLTFDQIQRLHKILTDKMPVYSSNRSHPVIYLRLQKFLLKVQQNLQDDGIRVRDIRLNGGAASYVIHDDPSFSFNDLDFIIGVDMPENCHRTMQKIKYCTLRALMSFSPAANNVNANEVACYKTNNMNVEASVVNSCQELRKEQASEDVADLQKTSCADSTAELSTEQEKFFGLCAVSESYLHKQIMVTPNKLSTDCWSFLCLGHVDKIFETNDQQESDKPLLETLQVHPVRAIDLKFVYRMRRPYEFTVDSFQIILNSLLNYCNISPIPFNKHFYPTVIANACSGNFYEALTHLQNKQICIRHPEEIRGGGLLKYCRLLLESYVPAPGIDITNLELYMCSRFFIDYAKVDEQRSRIETYLTNHFINRYDLKVKYLQVLQSVVWSSSMCLMKYERVQTLRLIELLIAKLRGHSNFCTSEVPVTVNVTARPDSTSFQSFVMSSSLSQSQSLNNIVLEPQIRNPCTVVNRFHPNQQQQQTLENTKSGTNLQTTFLDNSGCVSAPYFVCVVPPASVSRNVSIEDIGGQNWVLDAIYYGTEKFPMKNLDSLLFVDGNTRIQTSKFASIFHNASC